jgi:hypothetical protein
MKLTEKQKSQGKWQREFSYKRVARTHWLKPNDRKLLTAILDRRHMKHDSKCVTDCEPGWAKIPWNQLKKATGLGQEKLNETIKRLVEKNVVKRVSKEKGAGRDGATRYRIIKLPAYEPSKENLDETVS